MSEQNLIGIYPSALDPEFCQRCIDKFEHSTHSAPGRTGFGEDAGKKRSRDITLNSHLSEWQQELAHLQRTVLTHLMHYVRQHPFLLSGAIALQVQGADGVSRDVSADDISQMSDRELADVLMHVYRLGTVNIQKYRQNEGGYFHWHSEHYPHPRDPQNTSLHRVLLWMFYLNDVTEGGETEFYYQQLKSKPAQGTLLIAPASFTHTHRGHMPLSSDKYIFTSWVLYQPAELLYGKVE